MASGANTATTTATTTVSNVLGVAHHSSSNTSKGLYYSEDIPVQYSVSNSVYLHTVVELTYSCTYMS